MNIPAHEIQLGTPKVDGRYVVFFQCESHQAAEWVEPVIMTYAGNRWHLQGRKVLGWIGPLPVMKVADLDRSRGETITVPIKQPLKPVRRKAADENPYEAIREIMKPGFGETSPNPEYDL